MKITIDITDDKHLELIEQLRGEKSAKEFVQICCTAGLGLAAHQRQQYRQAEEKGQLFRFAAAKPEFRTLDVAAITTALKDKDQQNPVRLEVSRLVQDISAQLKGYAEKNGNRLPASLKVNARAPIEKMAFQITSESIKASIRQENAKETAM